MKTTIKKPNQSSVGKTTIKKPVAKKKKSQATDANKARMALIQSVAKQLWATGKYKKYHEVVAEASKQLKAEGKL